MMSVECPHCKAELALHQPDPDLPDRILAVCVACKGWYLVDDGGAISAEVIAPVPAAKESVPMRAGSRRA